MAKRVDIKMFNGVVLDEIMAVDSGIIWCWQKGYADRVVRVSVIDGPLTGAAMGIAQDDLDGRHSPYRAIYLDGDIIAAINYAKGLVDGQKDS